MNWNNIANGIITTKKWLQENHSLVLTFATLVLVVITFLYLLETRRQRLLLQKSTDVDTQPKIFFKTIKTVAKPDFENNKITIHTNLVLSNCGKIEGRSIYWKYSITQEKKVLKEGVFGPFQYLYPEQTATASIENLSFSFSPEEMRIVKKAVELGKDIEVAGSLQKPVLLNIELVYENVNGQKTIVPYTYRYLFPMNAWVFPSQKE